MMRQTPSRRKTTIGWSEYVDLPDWGIRAVKTKIDTGARTSALHVDELEIHPDGSVSFYVVLSRKHRDRRVKVTCPLLKRARVRSSTGEYSTRCFVRTRIRLGPVEKEIEISLVSREKMLFRMLLGRKALEKDFLVDSSRRKIFGGPDRKGKNPT